MLTHLHIENLGAIRKVNLSLQKGLCVFSGESGSGKSTIFDAISLLFGARNNRYFSEKPTYITGKLELNEKNRKLFEAAFKYVDLVHLLNLLDEEEFLIIKREITTNNRSKISINGESISLAQLRKISKFLLEICSQHSQHSLADESNHIDILDSACLDQDENKVQLKSLWTDMQGTRKNLFALLSEQKTSKERLEYYLTLIKDLENLNCYEDEEEKLTLLRKDLMKSYKAHENISLSLQLLNGSEQSILTSLGVISKKLKNSINEELYNKLSNSEIELNDIAAALSDLSANEDILKRIDEIEIRIGQIRSMARKYMVATSDLPRLLYESREKIKLIETSEDIIEKTKKELEFKEKQYLAAADFIGSKRIESAKKLEKEINANMKDLHLDGINFKIKIQKLEEQDWSPKGNDDVRFLVKIKTREDDSELLCKINEVSGGELSRIILSIKAAVSLKNSSPIVIFDEVDIGISGATATKVGKKLKSLTNDLIIVITHQPQVACYASSHFLVYKDSLESKVKLLNYDERQKEVARMLADESINPESLAAAKAMLKKALKT